MSKRIPIDQRSLARFNEYTCDLANQICDRHGLLLGWLFSGKKVEVVYARQSLIFSVMDCWVQKYETGKCYLNQVETVLFFPKSASENPRTHWSRLSTVLMGILLGLDHTSIMNAFRRLRNKPLDSIEVLVGERWISQREWYQTRWLKKEEEEHTESRPLLGPGLENTDEVIK